MFGQIKYWIGTIRTKMVLKTIAKDLKANRTHKDIVDYVLKLRNTMTSDPAAREIAVKNAFRNIALIKVECLLVIRQLVRETAIMQNDLPDVSH